MITTHRSVEGFRFFLVNLRMPKEFVVTPPSAPDQAMQGYAGS